MSQTERDLVGKIAVISGGTSGIGRATALMLAHRGAEVIIVGRDQARGAEIEADLRDASGGQGAFIKADLSLISEARGLVSSLTDRFSKIDALVQSAGVFDSQPMITSEGLDRVFVTNFLHKQVLAEGLNPLLKNASGRMILVAANIPDWVTPGWSNFEGLRVYSGVSSLARLHAASLALVQGWASSWGPIGIEVTAIHPGQVNTGIYRSFDRWPWKPLKALASPLFVDVQRPAELVCWLAFSPDAKGASGSLFPAVKDFKKRRMLARSLATVERVQKTARAVLLVQ